MWKRVALLAVAALVLLVAVVVYRTATYEAPAAVDLTEVKLAPVAPVDAARAAAHLGEAVRFRTINNQNPADNDWTQWDQLHAWLQATYPAAHVAMTREVVAGHGLIYTWQGSDASLAPIVLMAHQDVVPVTPGTEKDWTHPPFDGVVADGAVWGRGS
ncbi:MAG TPA: peptidase M20, partial [Caulobacteraceae bacterium]